MKNLYKKFLFVIIGIIVIGGGYALFKSGEYTSIQDKDYPKLISGGLTKDEVGMALGFIGVEYQDNELGAQKNGQENSYGLSEDELHEKLGYMCGDDMIFFELFLQMKSVDRGGDYNGYIVYPMKDLNKFRSFWNVPLYRKNTNGPEDNWFTDDTYLYHLPGLGEGPVLKDVIISKAEYKDDDMKIYFDIRWYNWMDDQNYKGSFVANLERKDDNRFSLVDVEYKN